MAYELLPELFRATEVDRLRDVVEEVHADVVAAPEAGETGPAAHDIATAIVMLHSLRSSVQAGRPHDRSVA